MVNYFVKEMLINLDYSNIFFKFVEINSNEEEIMDNGRIIFTSPPTWYLLTFNLNL